MVSQHRGSGTGTGRGRRRSTGDGRRGAGDSRARLLEAAAEEFAALGFDGAKVDRIAARARLNKAMLYYHFANKAALYREVLRGVFGGAAEAVEHTHTGGPAEDRLRAFIVAVANSAVNRPHFPAIWLREIADGGRHVDEPVIAQMRRVMHTLARILSDGRAAGRFRNVHPLIAQMGIVAPLLFFAASGPARERLRDRAPFPMAGVTRDDVIEYVQAATIAALAGSPTPTRSRRKK